MDIAIIIPAYNEEKFIKACLESLLNQTYPARKILVVDDGSGDKTPELVEHLASSYENLSLISRPKSFSHEPGGKIVETFNAGLKALEIDYDVICKFDADLIFPENYLEVLTKAFQENPKLGMYGGFCTICKEGTWQVEQLTNADHLRGALKAYRKTCFTDIEGLTPAMGWDTIDEMKARFYGWEVKTNPDLLVKHLKPTGQQYKKNLPAFFGTSLFRMRYSWSLALLTCLKMANNKSSLSFFLKSMTSFQTSSSKKSTFLVTEQEGAFIRSYRWSKLKERLFQNFRNNGPRGSVG
ncbi:glycosyltransferase family 2 protein [Psychroflexus sp. YR1-1]|uniref:Glycosyltransferase family 2 protein n=1 Tax=Psychroflexus aurantiacus TaxID=2709310 RepID=A0A6B3RBX1_9FLAO|nr:glycosyltransferase family 2 protein [Psychroflexus aurantiacus]NEV95024.1 glycosyltransferase family 2 protein [Psychroflexus aurantiacus]